MSLQTVAAAPRAAWWFVFMWGLWLASSPSVSRAEDGSPRAALRSTNAGAGAKRLQGRCARCHDADGTGRSSRDQFRDIPDFSNHKWQSSRSDAELMVSILEGKGSHMPSYRGKFGDEETRALVASVRAFDPMPTARRADTAPDDFERRFRELQEELDDLKKQFRELSAPRRKP